MDKKINLYWSESAVHYNSVVREGMGCGYENDAWKGIFTEHLGAKRLRILDVGTGPGVVALQLAQLGHDVLGVDFSTEMLRAAMENSIHYHLDIKFAQADAERLPFADGEFDAVVSKYVLWTLPDPERALKEWHRVVKPGGRVLYVDGNWTADLERSWARRRWRDLALAYIKAESGSWARKHKLSGGKEELWSIHADRPNMDVEIMKGIGFEAVKSNFIPCRRVLKGARLFKYGYYDGNFLVTGIKKVV